MQGEKGKIQTAIDGDVISAKLIGLGLRTEHFPYLLQNPETQIGWFEAITENFLNSEGAPLHVLTQIRERYPVALHGVALSIGSVDGVRLEYLKKIKTLAERIEPFQISDHFCFSRFGRRQYHELLPLPLTFAMAKQTVLNIEKVQSYLKRPLVLENISAYAEFPHNELGEPEFLNFIAEKSGCKLLLDINNIYVNAANFRFNARRFVGGIDPRHVAQYHLAGFTDLGTHLFDTHAEKIHNPVLRLYREARHHIGERPVSLERDDRIPAFKILEREIVRTAALKPIPMPEKFSQTTAPLYPPVKKFSANLKRERVWQRGIYTRAPQKNEKSAGELTVRGVQRVYRNAYAIRLGTALNEKFTGLASLMPEKKFNTLIKTYIAKFPSTEEDLGQYGGKMPKLLAKQPRLRDTARADLARFELHAVCLPAKLSDPFSKKVTLSRAAKLLPGKPARLLYRDRFAVADTQLNSAEYDFMRSLLKPIRLNTLIAVAETEKRLSAESVRRLFRILGLPGILV
jgi:uncharacterized protein (UPF0276 family)